MSNVMSNDPFYKAQGPLSTENDRILAQDGVNVDLDTANTEAVVEKVEEKGPDTHSNE